MLEYAFVDRGVPYAGHTYLFVDGKELGRVPRLAICQDLDGGDVVLFHCSATWRVLGVAAGFANVRAGKDRAARIYRGLSWTERGMSKRDATTYLKRIWKGSECSLCGRRPGQVERVVEKKGVRICDVCVKELSEALAR